MSGLNGHFRTLVVKSRPGAPGQGQLIAGGRTLRCALGRSGIGIKRREGDGITPRGSFGVLGVWHRAHWPRATCRQFPHRLITPDDGWCDAVGDRNYNRAVRLPYRASHEELVRQDHLYDVLMVMDFNVNQRITRGGSAIFVHLAHEDYRPTEGCIAISRRDMLWLLPRLSRQVRILVG